MSKSMRVILLLLTIALSPMAGCADSQTKPATTSPAVFSATTQVMLFSPNAGHWMLATFGQAKPGDEFYSNNRLYRLTESKKAVVVPGVDSRRLLEADIQLEETSRRPSSTDVVQVRDRDLRFVEHAVLGTVQPGAIVRFQGRAYKIKADRSLSNTGATFSSANRSLQRIEISRSGMQHIIDRHTSEGTMNAGKSIFYSAEEVRGLIVDAQLTGPVAQARGNYQRIFDAGRPIGMDRATRNRTSTYTVITTELGNLVTAFPGLP